MPMPYSTMAGNLASGAHRDIQTINFPIKGEQSTIYKENESSS
jgi:hypothetical protein